MGIEPTALAWEARVLPLYDARDTVILHYSNFTVLPPFPPSSAIEFQQMN